MSSAIPKYLYPPKGIAVTERGPGGFPTRRNKDYGPYGIFIEYTTEEALPTRCSFEKGEEYMAQWLQAEGDLHALLWGSEDVREQAKRSLDALNDEIRGRGSAPQEGLLEVKNWYNAGLQLKKAVRDFHVYGSTARFEDVRDFIWERISIMNYPYQWRVKREDFLGRIADTAPDYARKEGDLDTEDAVFQEWQLENPPRRPALSLPPSYHTNSPTEVPSQTASNRVLRNCETLQSQEPDTRPSPSTALRRPAPRLRRRVAARPTAPSGSQNTRHLAIERRRSQRPPRQGNTTHQDDYPEESPRMRRWLNLR
jgi:hypothetical protein